MPIQSRKSEILPQPAEIKRALDPETTTPYTSEVIGAWLVEHNSLFSAVELSRVKDEVMDRDERTASYQAAEKYGHDPYSLPENQGYPGELFIESRSSFDDAVMRRLYDNRQKNQEMLSRSKWWQNVIAMPVTMGTDPVVVGTMVPGSLAVKGMGVAKGAGVVGAEAGAAELLSEMALHQTQPLRTKGETAMNVSAAVVFGGALGGLVGRMGRKDFNKLVDSVDDEFLDAVTDGYSSGSAGAAMVSGAKVEQMPGEMTLSKGGQWIAKANEWLKIPEVTAALSQGPLGKIAEKMDNSIMERLYHGFRASEESVGAGLRRLDGNLAMAKTALRGAYKEVRALEKIDYTDFKAVVADAMRYGDKTARFADPAANAAVGKAAKAIREEVFDHLWGRVTRAGLIDESFDIVGKETYLNRVYNVRAMKSDPTKFKRIARNHYMGKGKTEIEANEIADSIFRSVTRTQHGFMPIRPGKAGSMKPVVYDVDDAVIKDFLIDDVDLLMDQYAKSIGPHVELAEKFGRSDMQDQIDEIKKYYDNKAQDAAPDVARKMHAQGEKEIEILEAWRDRHLGRYRLPEDPDSGWNMTLAGLRALQVPVKLGSVVLSSLTETVRPIFHYGMKQWSGTMMSMASAPKLNKLQKADMQRMGVAVDLILGQSRLHSYASLADLGHSRFYSGLHKFSNVAGWGVGITPWTYMMRRLSGGIIMNGVLDAAQRWPKLSKAEKIRMRNAGLDGNLARTIRKEFAEHGIDEKGLKISNSDKWASKAAARRFETIMVGEVDALIINPSAGGQSLFMSSPLQKTLFQFKSFPIESITKIMIPAMQGMARGDAKAYQGIMMTMMMAGIGVGLREASKGNDPSEMTWKQFNREMVDRSGVTGIFFDMNNTMEKITNNRVGLASTLGESRRYSTRGPWGAVLGPSAGYVEDAQRATNLLSEERNRGDLSAARRMMPLQNLFFLRNAIDDGEDAVANYLGMKPKKKYTSELEGTTVGETLDGIGL